MVAREKQALQEEEERRARLDQFIDFWHDLALSQQKQLQEFQSQLALSRLSE
ncbi:hypothetical protein TRAPUB_13578 [Trametes pubescens]|uniref:Uncharacterized protein n=1 Tax=Trametes pubescens TaxID=154538 RepID=A0A1M2VQQ6_TRAPU|nr:hypothetical protein TRAPUB_13578 [Trametes pubescens]